MINQETLCSHPHTQPKSVFLFPPFNCSSCEFFSLLIFLFSFLFSFSSVFYCTCVYVVVVYFVRVNYRFKKIYVWLYIRNEAIKLWHIGIVECYKNDYVFKVKTHTHLHLSLYLLLARKKKMKKEKKKGKK